MNSLEKNVGQYNMGALRLLHNLKEKLTESDFGKIIKIFESKKIFGWKIWCVYKDVCKQDFDKFIEVCIEDKIPEICPRGCILKEN